MDANVRKWDAEQMELVPELHSGTYHSGQVVPGRFHRRDVCGYDAADLW